MLDRNKQNPLDNIDKFEPGLDYSWKFFKLNREQAHVSVEANARILCACPSVEVRSHVSKAFGQIEPSFLLLSKSQNCVHFLRGSWDIHVKCK